MWLVRARQVRFPNVYRNSTFSDLIHLNFVFGEISATHHLINLKYTSTLASSEWWHFDDTSNVADMQHLRGHD